MASHRLGSPLCRHIDATSGATSPRKFPSSLPLRRRGREGGEVARGAPRSGAAPGHSRRRRVLIGLCSSPDLDLEPSAAFLHLPSILLVMSFPLRRGGPLRQRSGGQHVLGRREYKDEAGTRPRGAQGRGGSKVLQQDLIAQ